MTEEKKALISRIKIENDQTATIEFKKTTDMDTSNVTFSGKEKVTEEFAAKFQESVNSFVEIFPALKPETQNITMNAIKFDYGSDERIIINKPVNIKCVFFYVYEKKSGPDKPSECN